MVPQHNETNWKTVSLPQIKKCSFFFYSDVENDSLESLGCNEIWYIMHDNKFGTVQQNCFKKLFGQELACLIHLNICNRSNEHFFRTKNTGQWLIFCFIYFTVVIWNCSVGVNDQGS